jgi:cytidine deaminase
MPDSNMQAPSTRDLIDAALAIRENAHVPYSHFKVGAAIRTHEGGVFAGCNVENAAYPQGTCAEAGAIAAMVGAGQRRIREVVVVGSGHLPVTPCGGCRQKLREFAGPEVAIHMVNERGELVITRTLAALLPDSFGPDHLG